MENIVFVADTWIPLPDGTKTEADAYWLDPVGDKIYISVDDYCYRFFVRTSDPGYWVVTPWISNKMLDVIKTLPPTPEFFKQKIAALNTSQPLSEENFDD